MSLSGKRISFVEEAGKPSLRPRIDKLSQLVTKESTGIHRKLTDHAHNLTQTVTQAIDNLRDVERSIRQRAHEEVYRVVDESAAAVDGLSTEFNVMGNRLLKTATGQLRDAVEAAKRNDELVHAAGIAMLDQLMAQREHTLFRVLTSHKAIVEKVQDRMDETVKRIKCQADHARSTAPRAKVGRVRIPDVQLHSTAGLEKVERDVRALRLHVEDERRAQERTTDAVARDGVRRARVLAVQTGNDIGVMAVQTERRMDDIANHARGTFASLHSQAARPPTHPEPQSFEAFVRITSNMDGDAEEVLAELTTRFTEAADDIASAVAVGWERMLGRVAQAGDHLRDEASVLASGRKSSVDAMVRGVQDVVKRRGSLSCNVASAPA